MWWPFIKPKLGSLITPWLDLPLEIRAVIVTLFVPNVVEVVPEGRKYLYKIVINDRSFYLLWTETLSKLEIAEGEELLYLVSYLCKANYIDTKDDDFFMRIFERNSHKGLLM